MKALVSITAVIGAAFLWVGSSRADDIYGSASYLTARSCAAFSASEQCATFITQPFATTLTGGPSLTSSSILSLPDGSSAYGSVAFGSFGLPIIKASSYSVGNDRINSNDIGYQCYTYEGASPTTVSYTATLHIDSSSTDGSDGTYTGGAAYSGYVAIWDPSIVGSFVGAVGVIDSLNQYFCGDPGVLAEGYVVGGLTGGDQSYSVTTQSCSDSSVLLTPGEQVLLVASLQLPSNRGGFADATHTYTVGYDPTLSPATLQNLESNLIPAISAVPARYLAVDALRCRDDRWQTKS
jgi:hypothetical protein